MKKVLVVFFVVCLMVSLFAKVSIAAEKGGFFKNLWRKASGQAETEDKSKKWGERAPVRPIQPIATPAATPAPVATAPAPKEEGAVPMPITATEGPIALFVVGEEEDEVEEVEEPEIELPDLPRVDIEEIPEIEMPEVSIPDLNIPYVGIDIPELPDIQAVGGAGPIGASSLPGSINMPTVNDTAITGGVNIPQIPRIPNIDMPSIPQVPKVVVPKVGTMSATESVDLIRDMPPSREEIREQIEKAMKEIEEERLEEEKLKGKDAGSAEDDKSE
ncbi:MAG: hypothetical protein HQ593_06925 [Candidatus Omnitrophica bacterium]|nr:hypothetical protein [Candidatus Omnitrophota bacterium]